MSDAPARQPSAGGMTATEVARRQAEEDAVVEAMARARCEADGGFPDDLALICAPGYARGMRTGRKWELYAPGALMQLRGHQAMEKACSGKVVQF